VIRVELKRDAQDQEATGLAERWRPWLGLLKDVLYGVLLWLLIITFVGQVREVPTGSMEPTILVGDRFWTDKLFLRFGTISRGDIVVFDPPFPTSYPYIKRVIGLPGETVEVRDGKVFINGEPLDEPYIAEAPRYTYGPVEIPADQYFVLGDNRNLSNDSHEWGLLSRDRIIARAVYRIWPLSRIGPIQ